MAGSYYLCGITQPYRSTDKRVFMKHRLLELDTQGLGQELMTWRFRQGISQREAAARFGVSRYTIIRMENGRYVGMAAAYMVLHKLTKAIREESEK